MDRIFYNSTLRDPLTNYPIYIFDTSYLPSTDVINYDKLIPVLMQHLPLKPYVLVMFSDGLNKISWVWGLKFIKSFMSNAINLNNLVKIFTVHDSWFIKSVTSVIHNYHTTKHNIEVINYMLDAFALEPKGQRHTTVVHCRTLSELSHYLNITLLKISLNIYKYDLQLENEIKLSLKIPPVINPHVLLSPQTNSTFYHHVYQLLNIINTHGCKKELIFYTPGKRDNIDILYQCISRNQLIWINDWDLYCIATVFKKIISDLPFALIPYKLILLPIQDDFEYTQSIFNAIVSSHQQHTKTINYDQLLLQLFQVFAKLVANEHITKHTTTTIAKCMAHCLSHEVVSTDKSHVLVIQRFIKNVLQYWDRLKTSYDFPSIEDIVNGKYQATETEIAYEMSYEVTYEEEEDGDDETRVLFNTSNILYSNSELELKENTKVNRAHVLENSPDSIDIIGGVRTGRTAIDELKSPLKAKHRGDVVEKSPPRPPRPTTRASSVISRDLSPSKTRQPKDTPPIPTPRLTRQQTLFTVVSQEQEQPGTTDLSNARATSAVEEAFGSEEASLSNDENVAPSSITVSQIPIRSPRTTKLTNKLTNVSNLQLQYPPQKYHFTKPKSKPTIAPVSKSTTTSIATANAEGQIDVEHQNVVDMNLPLKKKPVIRGRKVSQLAKLFEERSEGLEILNSM
ncbi:Ecm25 protein [Candida orthopsilosis Co 90-125]|uniref:Ecm25 protein n=1 Tax=Candida orthopsilosis (strain 90-125) TaxID=1136231 RepID=H8X528_CANO9|nr:Ecm25 protein [Candida orthopsilosis Co 90-125]CCG23121.1 Ecm25 protein [Candida orthopsilosis Co 90-125]